MSHVRPISEEATIHDVSQSTWIRSAARLNIGRLVPDALPEAPRRGCGARRAELQRVSHSREARFRDFSPKFGTARAGTPAGVVGSGPGKREEAAPDVCYAMRSSGARARYETCGEIGCPSAGRPAVPECHSLSPSGRYLVLLF